MRPQTAKIDYSLLLAVVALLVLSLAFIYTASSTKALERFADDAFFLKRQLLRIIVGIVALVIAMRVDYREWLRFAPWMFWGSVTLLLMLLVAPSEWTLRGTRRWLNIGGFRFQPSELAKFALIFLFARVLSLKDLNIKRFLDGVLPQVILVLMVCTAIILEPDTSTTIMIFMIALSMLFIAGAKIWHLLAMLATGLTGALLVLLSIPYQRGRLMNFLDAFMGKTEAGWQIKQSLISLGNGGVFGIGLGGSRQKMHWLPDPFTDFIYSIIGEELGLLGTAGVLALFVVIIFRGFRIALSAPDREGQLLAAGITIAISLYAFMNIAVITHLVPTTGIPMPFVSYGGSSLIMNLFGVGVLLNIFHQANSGGRRRSVPAAAKGRSATREYIFGL